MANYLLDALGQVGYALDTPGAYLRGALAGNLGGRSSGEELLASYGVDGGPLGGMAAEMVLDPLALAGPALGAFKGVQGINRATKGLAGLAHADDANPLVRAMAAMGDETGAFRPFQEIGRRTDPDFVNSVDWYHGTGTPGLTPAMLDPMKTDLDGLYGRGAPYMSAAPPVTSEYAATRAEQLAEGIMQDPAYAAAWTDWHKRRQELYSTADFMDFSAGLQVPGDPRGADVYDYILRRIGPEPSVPKYEPLIYEANTNFGKILDLDADPTQRFFDGMGDYAHTLAGLVDPDLNDPMEAFHRLVGDPYHNYSAGDMIKRLKPGKFWSLPPDMPDPLIKALREMGYDAMTHTGGHLRGGGRLLHDVMIALDPNDMISKVGRSGQITRFEPHPADELLRRLEGM